jgi:hypothetical protein
VRFGNEIPVHRSLLSIVGALLVVCAAAQDLFA